jgi:hypothetical protein
MSGADYPYAQPADEANSIDQIPETTLYNGRKASLPLDIIIIGCGLGGLAAAYSLGKAGHRVSGAASHPFGTDLLLVPACRSGSWSKHLRSVKWVQESK